MSTSVHEVKEKTNELVFVSDAKDIPQQLAELNMLGTDNTLNKEASSHLKMTSPGVEDQQLRYIDLINGEYLNRRPENRDSANSKEEMPSYCPVLVVRFASLFD